MLLSLVSPEDIIWDLLTEYLRGLEYDLFNAERVTDKICCLLKSTPEIPVASGDLFLSALFFHQKQDLSCESSTGWCPASQL